MSPQALRNPNNDPPRLGELIHYYDGYQEVAGLVARSEPRDRERHVFFATIFDPTEVVRVQPLDYDDYDPTEEPAVKTWHFHHHAP